MKKIIVVSSLFLLVAFPVPGRAHTYLSSSDPEDGQILTTPVDEITLQFETKVEELSTMSLYKNGEMIEMDLRLTETNQLVGEVDEELIDGEYTVDWSIIGEDGHPINGNLSFIIESADSSEEDHIEGETLESAKEPEQTEVENLESAKEPDGTRSMLSSVLTGLFALITLSGIWLLVRSKDK